MSFFDQAAAVRKQREAIERARAQGSYADVAHDVLANAQLDPHSELARRFANETFDERRAMPKSQRDEQFWDDVSGSEESEATQPTTPGKSYINGAKGLLPDGPTSDLERFL